MVQPLKSPLQAKLDGAGSMSVKRVQEGSSGDAIWPTVRHKTSRIFRTGVATDDVVSAAAGIVGIVNPKLCMVEDVKKLCPKLNLTGLGNFEVFQEGHVEVETAGVVQKVPPRGTEG